MRAAPGLLLLASALLAAQAVLASPGSAGALNVTLSFRVADSRGLELAAPTGYRVVVSVSNVTKAESCVTCLLTYTVGVSNATRYINVSVLVYLLDELVLSLRRAVNVTPPAVTVELGTLRTNASNVVLRALNDEGGALNGCEVEVVRRAATRSLKLACGKVVALPFGAYDVAKALVPMKGSMVEVGPLTASFSVSNGTSSVEVALGVASLFTLSLARTDGSPLLGAELELLYLGAQSIPVYKGVPQGGQLQLTNVPYGRYLVRVTWRGVPLLQRELTVDQSSRNATLITSVIPGVRVAVRDADGEPLAGIQVRVTGPALNETLTTDDSGYLVMLETLRGLYTFRVDWRGQPLTAQLYINGTSATLELPLRRVAVVLAVSGRCTRGCTLPPGLLVEVKDGRNATLASASTSAQVERLTLETRERVRKGEVLTLRVLWNGTLLLSERFTTWERTARFELPFHGLSILVRDARGHPLPGAAVVVRDLLGRRVLLSDAYGVAEARHLYGEPTTVEVYWGSLPVAPQRLVGVSDGSVKVDTCVFPLTVEVLGLLGPLSGAQVGAQTEGGSFAFTSTSVTGADGRAQLVVPLPPGTRLKLTVTKGRYKYVRTLTYEEIASGELVRVRTELAVDLGWLQLTTWDVAALAVVTALASASLFFALRYVRFRRRVKGLLVAYGYEEGGRASLLRALRALLGAERREREEEEGGLFEEY